MGNLDLFRPPQEIRELSLLQRVRKESYCSQRELSNKFGIALGLRTLCLKRMVRRGWIRITNLDHRRNRITISLRKFYEKAKLTLHLISWTVQHYSTLKTLLGKAIGNAE